MDYEKLSRKFRKKPLHEFNKGSEVFVEYDKNQIANILPHRDPFLLIDSIEAIDIENKAIMGKRTIDPADPVFKGHFPGYPLYPGVLHIEMIGQLNMCLFHFVSNNKTSIESGEDNNIRLVKIHHVLFQHEVLAGETVTVIGKQTEDYDGFFCKGMGQIVNKDGKICTVAIIEAYFV
jgi:3-hydroxyacyl-[acyl-carrier-protein] dehydratase